MKNSTYENICLIITGCISPNDNVHKLAVIDSYERRIDYVESIRYYIEETDVRNIVFCDNSEAVVDYNLMCIAREKKKNFEWLSFKGNIEKVLEKGKGYGECEIIDYIIQNSLLVSKTDVIIKVTGRLKVLNIGTILRQANKGYCYFELHNNYVDSRCWIANKDVYVKYFIGIKDKVNDPNGYYIEHVIFDKIINYKEIFHPLPFALNILGKSGSMGIVYKDSGIKYIVKSVKRFLMTVRWYILLFYRKLL